MTIGLEARKSGWVHIGRSSDVVADRTGVSDDRLSKKCNRIYFTNTPIRYTAHAIVAENA